VSSFRLKNLVSSQYCCFEVGSMYKSAPG